MHVKLTYMVVKYEYDAAQRLNWAVHRSDYFISKGLNSSEIIGTARPVTQRQPLFSVQETRRNQMGRIWGHDAEVQYQSKLSELDRLRHNDQFNVYR
jgi:hypothetical protein